MEDKKIDKILEEPDMNIFEFQRECAKLGVPIVLHTPGLSHRKALEIVKLNQKRLTSKELWNF